MGIIALALAVPASMLLKRKKMIVWQNQSAAIREILEGMMACQEVSSIKPFVFFSIPRQENRHKASEAATGAARFRFAARDPNEMALVLPRCIRSIRSVRLATWLQQQPILCWWSK